MPRKAKKNYKARRRAAPKPKKIVNTLPLYIILIIAFIGYFLLQAYTGIAVVLGVIVFFLIIAILVIEVSNGIKEEGFKKNLIEIAVAIILVLVLWFGLRALLNTQYPLDVVPSCSMLPALSRGDMIVLQGANQNNLVAPIVNVTTSQWGKSFSNINTEALECVAYNQSSTGVKLSQLILPGYRIGLLKDNNGSEVIVQQQSQNGSLIRYTCGAVPIVLQGGGIEQEVSTTAITIGNTTITGDKNNSIVVYQTVPQDSFYKDGDSYIVHRVYALVNVSGTYYTLTKGDNNPGLDIQYFNTPANLSQLGGKVIASIPYIGYVKLILSNNFVEPTGCNYTTEN